MPNNRAYFVLKVLDTINDAKAEARRDKIHNTPSPPPTLQHRKAPIVAANADGDTISDERRRIPGLDLPCFGIAGSTFVSRGTTMDAELYTTHLPNATNIYADTPYDGTL